MDWTALNAAQKFAVSRGSIPVFIANSSEVVGAPLAYFTAAGVTVGGLGAVGNKAYDMTCQLGIGLFGPFIDSNERHHPNCNFGGHRGTSVEVIECRYPLINRSNHVPQHVIHGLIDFLNERLGLSIKPTAFKGDVHLSSDEKSWDSQVHEIVGREIPFWIIVAGGKNDVTIKWWEAKRWQEVVNHFRGRIQFVQVGAKEHHHFDLEGVIDLRGYTDIRQLIRLVYHSQGVLCPVTSLMHLASAVEVKGGVPKKSNKAVDDVKRRLVTEKSRIPNCLLQL